MFFGEYSYEEDVAAQREEAKEEGLKEGLQQKAEETAKRMLQGNLSTDEVVQYSGLPLERVLELKKEI